MYSVNEKIHYGGSGVCVIQEIATMRFGRTREKYYVLKPVYQNSSVIYVPVENEALVSKMRPVLSREEALAFRPDFAVVAVDRGHVADVTAEAPSAVLSRVRPKCAVVMGSAALKKVFPGEAVRRGTWRVLNGVPAIATHHPNEVLRLSAQGARSAKLEVWNVLKLALARLGKTPPAINKKG